MNPNPEFWRDRRVFLTGHTGFKGGWLSLWLQQLGARVVVGPSCPPTEPSLFEVARVGSDMTSLTGDVLDLEGLRAAILEHQPEVIFHLAAQSLVLRAYAEPSLTYATNVLGTAHLLECTRPGTRSIESRSARRGLHNQRQMLRQPGMGVGLSGSGPPRRPRPLLEQQGMCGTGYRYLP